MHTARKHFIICKFSDKQDVSKLGHILQSYKYCDIVFSKRNVIDDLSPGTVIRWEHKQMLVKHEGTNVRVPLSHLVPYTGAYQSPSEDDKTIKPTPSTSQTWPLIKLYKCQFLKRTIQMKNYKLQMTKAEKHQTVTARSRTPKQNVMRKI